VNGKLEQSVVKRVAIHSVYGRQLTEGSNYVENEVVMSVSDFIEEITKDNLKMLCEN